MSVDSMFGFTGKVRAGSDGAGAIDLHCTEDVVFGPGEVHAVGTGVYSVFDPALVCMIKCRSGLALKGFSVEGGVIDSDYRGEWKVILRWTPPRISLWRRLRNWIRAFGKRAFWRGILRAHLTQVEHLVYQFSAGDRVAQFMILPSFRSFIDVQKLTEQEAMGRECKLLGRNYDPPKPFEETTRGSEGFGSTGK